MDANGGRFHLLLGAADWGRCVSGPAAPVSLADLWADELGSRGIEPPAWDEGRSELTLPLAIVTLPATPGEVPLAQSQRRAAYADSNGNIYSIADDPTVLRVHSNGDGRSGVFWPDPRAVQKPRDLFRDADPLPATTRQYTALAVTEDAWLVAAFTDGGSRGLARFDLIGGGAPLDTLWPDDLDISATALVPRTGGGLWLLDGKNRRLYELDSQLAFIGTATGEIVPELFQPVDGELRTSASVVSGTGRDLSALAPDIDPIALAPLKGGTVAILSRSPARLYVLQSDGSVAPPLALDFVPHDLVFANVTLRGEKTPKPRLLLSGGSGNQARSYRVDEGPRPIRAHATTELFPMRRYGGRALVSVKGVAHYDSGSKPHWTPFVERPRVRFGETVTFLSPIFDGGTPDVVWDRLRIDGCVPPGTFVDVEARAADDRDPGPHETIPSAWLAQPRPRLALNGHELAGHGRHAMAATDTRAGRGTWELLFQRVRGRYLQLRIRMSGDGDASPRLRALRASYPRFSYAEKFLPAIYREDFVSGDFVERFLANMEGTNSVIEGRIATAQALFDARTVPPEALAWLADWFDVALDPAWDERRRRQFIARAATFFGWRGTLRGVEAALALAFDHHLDGTLFADCPKPNRRQSGIRIVESFLTRRLGALVAGDPTAPPGLATIPASARWAPAQGAARLVDLVAAALGRDPKTNEHTLPFPLFPTDGDDPVRWRAAMQQVLGFVPTAGAEERLRWNCHQSMRRGARVPDLPRTKVPTDVENSWREFVSVPARPRQLWQQFLSGRYRRLASLNSAHASEWTEFGLVPLPDHLPVTPAAQADWLQFEGRTLPIDASAHRFSVLLPVQAGSTPLNTQAALARRIVELEKPAHTIFDVRFYFAMNRIGEARIGLDTALGQGSRAPELLPPAVLGRAYLGESFLSANGSPESDGRRLLPC